MHKTDNLRGCGINLIYEKRIKIEVAKEKSHRLILSWLLLRFCIQGMIPHFLSNYLNIKTYCPIGLYLPCLV